jgi:hypothetical protein
LQEAHPPWGRNLQHLKISRVFDVQADNTHHPPFAALLDPYVSALLPSSTSPALLLPLSPCDSVLQHLLFSLQWEHDHSCHRPSQLGTLAAELLAEVRAKQMQYAVSLDLPVSCACLSTKCVLSVGLSYSSLSLLPLFPRLVPPPSVLSPLFSPLLASIARRSCSSSS